MGRTETYERIVATAENLFYSNGYRATGVDKIAAEAGVTKKTLYEHFSSKTDLVLAALRHRDALYLDWLQNALENPASTQRSAFLVLFDALETWIEKHSPNGCMFTNALSENMDVEPTISAAIVEQKRHIVQLLESLARDAGMSNPAVTARHIALLIEGAFVMARVVGAQQAVGDAKRILLNMVEFRPE